MIVDYCDADDPSAARFIRQMAETLLRSRIQGHSPEQCVPVKQDDCPHESAATKLSINFIVSTYPMILIYFVSAS